MRFRSAVCSAVQSTLVAGAVAAGLVAAGPAFADVMVLQSSAPALKAGATLKDDQKIAVPSGRTAVLMLPNGSTKTVTGPFEGLAGTFTKGLSRNSALWESVNEYVRTGGTSTNNVGATRGLTVARPQPTAGGGFSWTKIPVSANGDVCVQKGAELALERAHAGGELTITMVDLKSAQRAVVRFPAGVRTAKWPAALEVGVRTYAVLSPGAPMKKIQLRMISELPQADNVLRVLHGQRCLGQVQRYISGLKQ